MTNVGKLVPIYVIVADDQINFVCCLRLSNPDISDWMKIMNISNATGIHTYYANRILNITRSISIIPIVWQDVWDENVPVWFLSASSVLS